MKKITLAFVFIFSLNTLFSQEDYTINGETLNLKIEIEGDLDLLWNVFDNEFRYFVRTKDGAIIELKNTKSNGKTYLEEYKSTLKNLTKSQDMSTKRLSFTRYSLRDFIDNYNTKVDSGYTTKISNPSIKLRLGFSGGITNNPFVGNPDNIKTPLVGAELELYGPKKLSRHAGFFQVRHAFENDDFQYSTTELSLGYRYRFINLEKFSFYGQTKFATLNFSQSTIISDEDPMLSNEVNNNTFDVPLIFGLGIDYKISDNSYITLIYGELISVFFNNEGNFPSDISIGYKFDL